MQHVRGRLAGMVAEAGGTPHHLALAYPTGQLAFLDVRMLSDAGAQAGNGPASAPRRLEAGVWKAVEAHSKGTLTALAGHPHAPLLATATSSQVVKVWGAGGEQVGVVRAHSSFLAAHRIGPVTCLAFAPYELLLASGSADAVAAVYALEAGGAGSERGASLPPSPARTPPLPPPHAQPLSLAGTQTV